MLKYYPKLQNLFIQDTKALKDKNNKDWEDPPIVPECLSSQLKTCCIR
ncbi:F-box/FBD/LRR protein, partial [Trifolium medium]|nr:F-box/FBD/LRR protein [Trifolium medium]